VALIRAAEKSDAGLPAASAERAVAGEGLRRTEGYGVEGYPWRCAERADRADGAIAGGDRVDLETGASVSLAIQRESRAGLGLVVAATRVYGLAGLAAISGCDGRRGPCGARSTVAV